MAAALAKVIRGGRSGSSLLPMMLRRGAQDGVVPLLPHPPAPAAGMSRPMHTGQSQSSALCKGHKLAVQKALPFGTRAVIPQGHKLARMEQLSGKRFMSDSPFSPGPGSHWPWAGSTFILFIYLGLCMPSGIHSFKRFIDDE